MYQDLVDTIGYVMKADPEVGDAMNLELKRQRRNIELIASENIVSPAVMAAMGSVLTNKYAEGYPGKRYYGGCQDVDIVENIAIERAKKLFGANFANVQPHSGAQANTAVYFALLQPGDKVLGMSLAHGGHLTHGSPVNLSGKYFEFHSYGVEDDTETIDYDHVEAIAKEVQPKMIVAGASAYPRAIDFERLGQIAKEVGAYLMVDMAPHRRTGSCRPAPESGALRRCGHHHHPQDPAGSPGRLDPHQRRRNRQEDQQGRVPRHPGRPADARHRCQGRLLWRSVAAFLKEYAQRIIDNAAMLAKELMNYGFDLVSGGTDNHLMLVDTRNFHITGKELERRLDEVYITVNKNAIPNDPEKPFVTSGIRIGTPAVTSRGMQPEDMKVIAECIYRTAREDYLEHQEEIRAKVNELCGKYPLYE